MVFQQLVEPDPDIPCKPGWCLQYVRQTFGAPAVEPTATAGWNNAKYRHQDWDFPAECAVPVWFKLATEPAGHVALRMADGSVYSTSDDSAVPHHHPSLQDLIAYYWRNPLTYLGWSEDISGIRVVQESSIQTQSESITPLEDDMPSLDEIARAVWSYKNPDIEQRDAYQVLRDVPGDTLTRQVPHKDPITAQDDGQTTSLATMAGFTDYQHTATRETLLAAVRGIVDAVKAAPGPDAAQAAEDAYNAFAAKLNTIKVTVTAGGN
ncbi:hypothetical protein J7I84_08800 [Arthrobacter sp. ISL-85]|uniref:hypothetical protein n=1 Tax=Arthrobacter sp. ISL-85 TaxID=2819115 RepID=UPI001BE9D5A3|nr:hypothetical protein [Arthrobacter sp. ISL-85]MBT2566590.1 hypothetical protein [Arthrobacter sp. ISL-85]